MKAGVAPRLAAWRMMNAVTLDSNLLPDVSDKLLADLKPEERARAQRLCLSALRWADRADRIIGPLVTKKPDPMVHNLLRLAIAEVFAEQGAAHATVDAAVGMARGNIETRTAAGFVNAVLRRATSVEPEKWQSLPIPHMPKWLRKPLLTTYGRPVVEVIELAHSRGAPVDFTVKSPDHGLLDIDGAIALPTGSIRIPDIGQISALPGFDDGKWWVQDAAAALPAKLLKAQSGERVLDMCAAPGGKTLQLAAEGASVTALDQSAQRMVRTEENLKRTGLNAEIVIADALTYTGNPFDAILLDAPCSATGTIRRHPDLPHAKDGSGLPALVALQQHMLSRAVDLLKPGGRLVYCTCSLLPVEGEQQIDSLLGDRSSVDFVAADLELDGVPDTWRSGSGIRTRPDYWPELGGMDGFFMTVLRKIA